VRNIALLNLRILRLREMSVKDGIWALFEGVRVHEMPEHRSFLDGLSVDVIIPSVEPWVYAQSIILNIKQLVM
jgi:hypothetical protein